MNAKVKYFLHKAFHVILWVVFSIFLLFLILALSLQVNVIQNWVVDKVSVYLNENSNFNTEIGQIRLNWWDALELKGVSITDHRDSLMLESTSIQADFELLSLITPGDPIINAIRLEHPRVRMITHQGDSIMNINLWVDELTELFGSQEPSTSPVKFGIKSIELRQAEFDMVDYNSEPVTVGMDFSRLRFSDITANATDFYLDGGNIGISIKLLSGKELTSGLTIQELKTDLIFSPEFLELDKLSLKTKDSHIKDYLRLEYASTASFSNFLKEVVVIARLDETKLALRDLRPFVPSLPEINDMIYLSGDITGPVSDIKSEEFLIRIGEKTAIFGAFELDGLPEIQETYLNLSLKNSTILASDLKPYLPKNVQKEIQKFNNIILDADFTGYLERFILNGVIKTSIGSIDGRINYDQVKGIPTVVSRVKITNLDMGILAENPSLLQKISLDGKVNLKGNSIKNMLLDLDATISQVGINNYNYANIRTDATYGLDLFKGNLSINDPNLKMQAKGIVNLKESIDSVRMEVKLDTAFLDKLNLVEKATFISGNMSIDTKGIEIDDLQGIARFNDIKVGYDNRFLDVGDFFFQSLFAGGTRTISVNSDYVVAGASGQFNLQQMGSDLQILIDQYVSIILNEEQPLADLARNFSETYSLDLNVRMANINPIVQLFYPDFAISKNTILEGAFYQTPENTIFNFFSSIDSLTYQGNTALATNIDFNTSKIINSKEILASFYVYSKAQHIGKELEFTNLGLEAIWNQNEVDFDFSLDQDSTQSSARIKASAQFTAQNTKLTFKESLLKVLDREWEFDPANSITLTPGLITFSNVKIFNEDQFLSLEGLISENIEDKLNLTFNKVNIDLLNTLTTENFGGTANGLISISNIYDKPAIEGDIGVAKLSINDFLIGDLLAKAQLIGDRFEINVGNTLQGNKTLTLDGSIGLVEQDIDIDVNFDGASLVALEPFLSNYLSDLGGTITGDLKMLGTLTKPEIVGSTKVEAGKLRVNFLNTSYTMNGSLIFQPTEVNFRELIVQDLYGHEANFTGGIKHNGFQNIYLDIRSRLTNFQVLNTTDKDSDVFYGRAFVTGTLDVIGSTTNLDINARATSQPNTEIYIPLSSNNEQAQEEFIHIINVMDTVRLKEIAEEINRLEIENVRMNFVLDITPDAYAEIIIDPRTGEGISGRGRGVLTMNIDTQGNFNLSGNYEITQGQYNFSLYNVVKKQFSVQPGGRITWYGDPYQGVMNLTAEYKENLSLQPLMANSPTANPENNTSSRRYPTRVIMKMSGELLSPEIEFGFNFDEFPNTTENQTTIAAFQNRVANDDQEMNRQVFSVIMTRSFSPEGQFSGATSISSSLGQLLSSQLNSFIGQIDQNLEVQIDLASLDQNTMENFQLSVAYTFLGGRLRVSRDGGFTDNRGNAAATSIIGDWQAEYQLSPDGVYRVRIFNRNNFNTLTSLSTSKNVTTYGVSLSQNVSFNSFSELFKKITGKKEAKLRINDTDDFLREDYENGEKWTPINLDNLEERMDSIQMIQKSRPPEKDNF
jgi:hypothetical protein